MQALTRNDEHHGSPETDRRVYVSDTEQVYQSHAPLPTQPDELSCGLHTESATDTVAHRKEKCVKVKGHSGCPWVEQPQCRQRNTRLLKIGMRREGKIFRTAPSLSQNGPQAGVCLTPPQGTLS